MIEPKVLKGFRDALPSQEIVRKQIISKLEHNFSLFGFVPIDTPVLEYTEVLLGKGGGETDKQIFHFADNGGRDVALRFDLTVPFARFMAAHLKELPLPFKRYHIAKVWRGENPQKGRYREFFQCDFDIVGIDSPEADFEILQMMQFALKSLGLTKFTIRIAHRGLFNEFLETIECSDHSVEILRTVDKLRKIGSSEVLSQLTEICNSQQRAQQILSYITTDSSLPLREVLSQLSFYIPKDSKHLARLDEIITLLEQTHISDYFCIDSSITRGLDYYTGVVYETFLDDLEGIGSICSGGRYNNLAGLYTKEHLPGVGSSIGLDRLLAALEELHIPLYDKAASSDVILLHQDSALLPHYLSYAQQLREAHIRCEVYLTPKKSVAQFKYAQQQNIPYALLIDSQMVNERVCIIRNLSTREDIGPISIEEAIILLQRKC